VKQALEIAEALVRSGAVDCSRYRFGCSLGFPGLKSKEIWADATMGMQARLMSQACRKLSGAIKTTNTAVVFTNQLRQKIGVMFGNPENYHGWNGFEVLCIPCNASDVSPQSSP